MAGVHVVFGATGALGSAIVRELIARGEFVRAVVRDPEEGKAILPETAGIVSGDALDPESAASAVRGAEVVYDCVNVRYSKWTEMLPSIRSNVMAAARKASALLVYPDTVHAYGPLQRTPATEEHPRAALSKKGMLRAEIEKNLLDADRRGDVRAVIPRYPDLYGPYVVNPTIRPMFEAALNEKTATWPVSLEVPHDLVFVEDAARAAILLGSRDDAYGQVWHVPGPGPLTGRQFLETIFAEAGTKPRVRAVGKRLFRLFGYFIPEAGEMGELLYQYENPLILDGRKFAAAFPDFRFTPHADAIRQSVEWYKEMLGD